MRQRKTRSFSGPKREDGALTRQARACLLGTNREQERQMARRFAPIRRPAERFFPVRVRIAVPEGGFGAQLDDMSAWLRGQFGHDAFWIGSSAGPAVQDSALFYFLDAETATAFVDRFACGALMRPSPREEDRPR